MTPDDSAVLTVRDLGVAFPTDYGWRRVVEDVSFDLLAGETLALVGESGSGKSVTGRAVMGLIGHPAGRVEAGTIRFGGQDLLKVSDREMSAIRGNDLAMVFQEPMTSLDPVFTVGYQIAEVVRRHRRATRKAAWARAVEMLELVEIPDSAKRVHDYPHAFSGGMRQRVMIAMALACDPKILIADEPTTALDVTTQAEMLDLLRSLQRRLNMSVLFITHDLGVVADIADRVVLMYAGRVVEVGDVHSIFDHPRHPYTAGLLQCIPDASSAERLRAIPGRVPMPHELPAGCRFHPRCDYSDGHDCVGLGPPITLRTVAKGRATACIRAEELDLRKDVAR